MFGMLGWKHAYEPFDLAGYVPDYLVELDGRKWLFEVKPVGPTDDVVEHVARVRDAGWGGLVAVVGYDVGRHEDAFTDGGDVVVGHYSASGTAAHRLDLSYDGWDKRWELARASDHRRRVSARAVNQAIGFWRAAGNAVQWKPKS